MEKVKQKTINGIMLRKMLLSATKLLDANKEYVDQLNVFPVPDGDTGTNMSLTMMSVAKEVTNCVSNNIHDIANAAAKGALRGARGNSGVILSQIIKGIADTLASENAINPKIFAKALQNGTQVAYKAVTKPKEGTILTVVRGMGEAASTFAKKSTGIEEFFVHIIEAAESTLKTTPELLPVLKKAGVVDAGGRGLIIIFNGFQSAILGKEDSIALEFNDTIVDGVEFGKQFHIDYVDLADIEFGYCTEFFVINLDKKTTIADIDRFRDNLMDIGDCVLVIGDLELVKVHVHTNDPGKALSLALKLGEVDKIKIENMFEQNRALIAAQPEELKECGMVAVCAGNGLTNIFKELLVDKVIEGGQTMNPSAEDIAKVCDSVKAKDVFVFPNNPNIILAAEQAKHLSKRTIHVIPTRSIPEGLSAALCFSPDDTTKQNLLNMTSTTNNVKSGSVTYAVRNTSVDNLELKEGDIIGLNAKDIVSKGTSIDDATTKLIENMMDENISNITLYYGNDVSLEDAENLSKKLSKKYKNCDIDIHSGGQPLYYYIVSLE